MKEKKERTNEIKLSTMKREPLGLREEPLMALITYLLTYFDACKIVSNSNQAILNCQSHFIIVNRQKCDAEQTNVSNSAKKITKYDQRTLLYDTKTSPKIAIISRRFLIKFHYSYLNLIDIIFIRSAIGFKTFILIWY